MAILLLNHDINEKIQFVGDKIFEIEFLLSEAPKQLEAYENALNILKAIKRGVPRTEVLETYCSECCPPNKNPADGCKLQSCPACWLEYIESIKPEEESEETEK